jgi:phage terminase large subunit GpA-like protein
MTDHLQKITAAWNDAITPKPFYAVDEWVESPDGIILSSRTSGIPGPLRLDLTPYLREPLRRFSDSQTRRISLCFGAQAGKTTFIFCIMGYVIDYDPGPTMIVYPTMDMARGVSKDRIQPLIQDCPALRKHLTGAQDDLQLLAYTFDRLTVRFAWSNSESATRSHPIKYLLKDELSAFAPGASAAADERTKTFWNHKIVSTSTPVHEDDPIWREMGLEQRNETAKGEDLFDTSAWEPKHATSVYFYHIPCPRCGGKIRLEFSGLRWPKDCAIRELDEKGWYECQLCKGKITDAERKAAMVAGEWISENPGGKWVAYHLSSLYAPWETCNFGAIARKYLVAKIHQDPEEMQQFVNNYLALPYSLEQSGLEIVSDAAIENASMASGYQRNTIPAGVKALVMGCDVQGDCAYYIVIGFGANSEAWIISWGQVASEMALPEIAARPMAHPSGVSIRVVGGGVDARFKGQSVFDVCRKYRVLKPVQGQETIREPGKTTPIPFKTWTPDRDIKGRTPVNALTGLAINTVYFKQIIYSRLNPQDGQPHLIHMPTDKDEMLTRHLQSEQEVTVRKRGSAGYEKKWTKRKGFDANHLLDCTVYAYAIAYALKLFRLPDGAQIYGATKAAPAEIQPDTQGTPDPARPARPAARKKYLPLVHGYLRR